MANQRGASGAEWQPRCKSWGCWLYYQQWRISIRHFGHLYAIGECTSGERYLWQILQHLLRRYNRHSRPDKLQLGWQRQNSRLRQRFVYAGLPAEPLVYPEHYWALHERRSAAGSSSLRFHALQTIPIARVSQLRDSW